MQTILVLNSGSSSLKFSLVKMDDQTIILTGLADKLGLEDADISIKYTGHLFSQPLKPGNHERAVEVLFEFIHTHQLGKDIAGIGHRVVHGGEKFKSSQIINTEVLEVIEACVPFAPLHNPANLIGIKGAMKVAPDMPQVAVFDTAFHQTIAPEAYMYAVPIEWYNHLGVRRYGFHGTSHQYVTEKAASTLNLPLNNSAFISAHLGNGASACAVLNGKSVDTTMGFTPLEGLVMGTRSGDIDPGLPPYIAHSLGISSDEVVNILNKKSGLLGLSELSSDMRTLTDAYRGGHKGAILAIEVFVFRLARAIGSLAASLPRLDALIFTGGIGENAPMIRKMVLSKLKVFDFQLDESFNELFTGGKSGIITKPEGNVAMVLKTNEEGMIANQTIKVLQQL